MALKLLTRYALGVRATTVCGRLYCDRRRNDELAEWIDPNSSDRTKQTYMEMIKIFINRDPVYRRGHVEFIYSALKSMKEYGVEKDLEVYRALFEVLPKGKLVPQNFIQAEFMHYPKQQQCGIDVLQQMEDNGVIPDKEMQTQLLAIFGKRGYPLRKFWRMMYWMPKFKYADPFSVPRELPRDASQLAVLALRKMTQGVDAQTTIVEYGAEAVADAIEDTWIVSAQAPAQRELLRRHDPERPLYVEGAFPVWLRDKRVDYFTLRAEPTPRDETEHYDEDDVTDIRVGLWDSAPPIHRHIAERASVHEQRDGTYYGLCATGTSGKDSLLSWIRLLERNGNEMLGRAPVVFTLRSAPKEVATQTENENDKGLEKAEP